MDTMLVFKDQKGALHYFRFSGTIADYDFSYDKMEINARNFLAARYKLNTRYWILVDIVESWAA